MASSVAFCLIMPARYPRMAYGSRWARATNAEASASSTKSSFFGFHFNGRPTRIAMLHKWHELTVRWMVSTSATLHMEDTSPTAIGTAGSPNVVAAPVRSLFQTDVTGIKMVLPVTWAMRRAGQISMLDTVAW